MENITWLNIILALITLAGIMLIGQRLKRDTAFRDMSTALDTRLTSARAEIEIIDAGVRARSHRLIPVDSFEISPEDMEYLTEIEKWQNARLSKNNGRLGDK